MKIVAYTDGGSVELNKDQGDWIAGWGLFVTEENGTDIRTYAGMGPINTNNRAEMTAYIKLLEMSLERGYTELQVHIDSQLTIRGATQWVQNWERKNYIKRDGEPVKNADLWRIIHKLQVQCGKKGIKINITWVKGHSGVEGNEIADDLATRGLNAARVADYEQKFVTGALEVKEPEAEEGETPKKKKKVKVPVPHPLVCGRRIMDVVNAPVSNPDEAVYYTMSFDDTDKIKSRFCGVASSERFEAVVVLNERLPLIHEMHELQSSQVPEDFAFPVLYMWDKITSAARWKELMTEGISTLHVDKTNDLYHWDKDTQFSHVLRTPRCAKFSLETMDTKRQLLADFQAGVFKDENIHDVTDYFYETSAKGKMEARKELTGVNRIDHRFDWNGHKALIAMAVNYEIPDRNVFARVAKEDKEVNVQILIHDEGKTTFRWSMVVTTPNAVAMFSNPSRNLIVLP